MCWPASKLADQATAAAHTIPSSARPTRRIPDASSQPDASGRRLSAGKASSRRPARSNPERGSSSMTTLPPPARGWIVTSPPHWRTSSRAIASPRPLPAGRPGRRGRGGTARTRAPRSSSPIPGPRSRTSIRPGGARDRHRVPWRRIVQRVLDERVKRAIEIGRGGPHRSVLPSATCSSAIRRSAAASRASARPPIRRLRPRSTPRRQAGARRRGSGRAARRPCARAGRPRRCAASSSSQRRRRSPSALASSSRSRAR